MSTLSPAEFATKWIGSTRTERAAYQQLLQYREALDSPPLLVVSDLDRFEVHTNFTNTPATVYRFNLTDLLEDPREPLRILRAVMIDSEDLRPGRTRDELTAEAAEQFASLAEQLRGRGHKAHAVAHSVRALESTGCVF